MEGDLKEGDVVVLKNNTKERFTIVQIDIDRVNANCTDASGKPVTIPLISLKKEGYTGWVGGVYPD